MINIAKFNLRVIWKRKSFLNMLLLTPVIAFLLTISLYMSDRNLIQIGNPIYSSFFFNMKQNGTFNLFLIGLPLLCALIYGDYYYYEKSFVHEIIIRGKNKSFYYITNAAFSFLCGFLIIALFLSSIFLFNFLITNNPEHTLSILSSLNENDPSNQYWWLYQLFYEQPYVYVFIRSLTICILAGFLSLTTYSVSLFVKAKILAYMFTMAITLGMAIVFWIFFGLTNWATTVSFKVSPTIVRNHELVILFWYGLFLGISSLLIFIKCRKEILS